jgi:hypothetical protein
MGISQRKEPNSPHQQGVNTMKSNPFLRSIENKEQVRRDRNDASSEAEMQFEDDFLKTYETCHDFEQRVSEKELKALPFRLSGSLDWGYPDSQEHHRFLAKQRQLKDQEKWNSLFTGS